MTTKPVSLLYFAYNENLSKKQMKERAPDSAPKLTATLPNYRLVFLGWSRQWKGGTASIRNTQGQRVQGGVYEISERDLRRLDNLEGYPGQSSHLNVTVYTEAGAALKALTHVRTGQLEETKPSMSYLEVIKQGYRDWGIV
jgi:gamma-glutamylcyclotransferase (GGCT)/AIG2-like uncharacterized protein YtfP